MPPDTDDTFFTFGQAYVALPGVKSSTNLHFVDKCVNLFQQINTIFEKNHKLNNSIRRHHFKIDNFDDKSVINFINKKK